MSLRFGWLLLAFCATSMLGSCAEGAPAAPPGQVVADAQRGIAPDVCGDGMKGRTEPCDCPATTKTMCMPPEGTTCESLGFGTGPVYCAAGVCNFVTSSCTMPPPGGGAGTGAGRGG